MALPPEVHSALISSGPGRVDVGGGGRMEHAERRIRLSGRGAQRPAGRVQAGAWEGPLRSLMRRRTCRFWRG
ncbi:PPE domain protein [Mycobacterium xenopi 4042]|uniref:PPE domain protein n=1 Tax=Mycobacterium xenopi 4042 TaxID=1299334 RepID=X7YR30_MYCXE|nr:PPE domain protein [Mycobacterium xenopi 4042]